MSVKISTNTIKVGEDGPPGYHYECYGTVQGSSADDFIAAPVHAGWDFTYLSGGGGNDTIWGNDGWNSKIDGGNGNDLIRFTFFDSGIAVDGGRGNDTLDFSRDPYSNDSGVVASLATGRARLIGPHSETPRMVNIENLVGTDLGDSLTGNQEANWLYGWDGDDTLVGSGGADTLDGGSGFDTADYSALSSSEVSISANLAAGTIVKQHTVTKEQYGQDIHFVARDTDTIRNIEAVVGTNNNDYLNGTDVTAGPVALYGKGGADLLFGSVGNDTLNGGAGNDYIAGGAGDDRIEQDSWSGNDSIYGGGGNDVADYSGLRGVAGIESHIVANLGLNRIEKFQAGAVSGTDRVNDDVEQVIGTAFNDVLYGDAGANRLSGGAGNDTFSGAAGNDMLDGGSGNDLLIGGAGNDTMIGGAGNDTIRLDGGGDDRFIFNAHFGLDRIVRLNAADAVGISFAEFKDVSADNVLFQRQGDDLRVTIAGTTDLLTLVNWFGEGADSDGNAPVQVDEFGAGDVWINSRMINQQIIAVGSEPISLKSMWNEIAWPLGVGIATVG